MDVPLVLAQIEATRRTVTAIVFGLLAVAATLALLTAWYWRVTDPRRAGGSRQTPPPRRKRRNVEAPEPNGPQGHEADSPEDRVGDHPMEPVVGAGPDQTRVMDRSTILDLETDPLDTPPPSPSPRSRVAAKPIAPDPVESATEGSSRPGAAPVVASGDAAVAEDEIDLRRTDSTGTTPNADGPRGAHDDGVSFDEWLAMAEED